MKKIKHAHQGFTLIEILIVMGLVAILATVVLVALNPARQFAQARDTQRASNVNAILNAIGQNITDNKGVFTCGAGALPAAATDMASGSYDIRTCLVPTYLSEIPTDPKTGTAWDGANYDTSYTVMTSATSTGRITVAAAGEVTNPISVTR